MTFFVTSTGSAAQGGNLGGLAGADKKCQDLATAANAGDHTWHAYLSVAGTNAKDRIGTGPWTNQKGTVVAADLASLHGVDSKVLGANMLDEKGAPVPVTATSILTGTKYDGTALAQTCQDWTSSDQGQRARTGDSQSDTSIYISAHWNDESSSGCAQNQIIGAGGEGRIYCFATN
jgi:hypothetical protein